jgi:hypothetical protein
MEIKTIDEENEHNQKENPNSEEVNIEVELDSALEEVDRLRGKVIK